jgi:hypothetical protein
VRIQREPFRELKKRFLQISVQSSVEELCRELQDIPYESYSPVRDQMRILLRAVNCRRRLASLDPVPVEALRLWRNHVKPFDNT